MKINIVGCGISGITAAILLKQKGYNVEIFETKNHIGGNCYDSNINNIIVHNYGAHIFHTKEKKVWDFLNKYSSFNNYKHKVFANTKLGIIPIPFNKNSEKITGKLTQEQIKDLIFIEYSSKQWGIPWEELPNEITKRVPMIRNNRNNNYFLDKYQGIPTEGYTKMFEKMLKDIKVNLNCNKNDFKKVKCNKIFYSGMIDEYYNYKFGKLKYRSLKFKHYQDKRKKYCILNECNNNSWTKCTDNSHFLKQKVSQTIMTKEYPCKYINGYNEPFYPCNFVDDKEKIIKYNQIKDNKVIFIGRLGKYKYLDIDKAILETMKIIDNF